MLIKDLNYIFFDLLITKDPLFATSSVCWEQYNIYTDAWKQKTFLLRTIQYLHRCLKTKDPLFGDENCARTLNSLLLTCTLFFCTHHLAILERHVWMSIVYCLNEKNRNGLASIILDGEWFDVFFYKIIEVCIVLLRTLSGKTLSGEIFLGQNYSSGEVFVTRQKIKAKVSLVDAQVNLGGKKSFR